MQGRKNAAIGIIFSKNKTQVLLVKRRDVPVWVLPGGGIDEEESPDEAVVREVFEETGLKVKVVRQVGEYYPINRLAKLTHVFECEPLAGEMQTSPETEEISFFPLDNLPILFFVIHQKWLNDALRNLPSTIVASIKEVSYWNLFKYFLRHPIHVIRFIGSTLFKSA